MKLEIEFIHRPRLPWMAMLFCLAAAACFVVAVLRWSDLYAEQQKTKEQIAKLELLLKERQRALLLKPVEVDSSQARKLKEQQKILAALRYPWNRVLSPIEKTDANDVAILSLFHDQANGKTQLVVEAFSATALLNFAGKLNNGNEGEENNQWYLASYQMQTQNNPPTVKVTFLNR